MFGKEKSFKTLLYSIDNISPDITLQINSHRRLHSIIGLILTIWCYWSIFGITWYFFLDWISQKNLNIISFIDKLESSKLYNWTNKVWMISMTDVANQPISPQIGELNVLILHYSKDWTNYTKIPLEPCDRDKHLNNRLDVLQGINWYKFTCLNTEGLNMTIFKDESMSKGGMLVVFAGECVNSTSNNNWCKPKDEIEEYFKNTSVHFNFYIDTNYIDHYDKEKTFKETFYKESIKMNFGFKYMFNYYFNQINYQTDGGLIYSSVKEEYNFIFSSDSMRYFIYEKSNQFIIKEAYYQIQFHVDGTKQHYYTKSYPKLPTMIANAAGIVRIVMVIAEIISSLCLNTTLYLSIFENSYLSKSYSFIKNIKKVETIKQKKTQCTQICCLKKEKDINNNTNNKSTSNINNNYDNIKNGLPTNTNNNIQNPNNSGWCLKPNNYLVNTSAWKKLDLPALIHETEIRKASDSIPKWLKKPEVSFGDRIFGLFFMDWNNQTHYLNMCKQVIKKAMSAEEIIKWEFWTERINRLIEENQIPWLRSKTDAFGNTMMNTRFEDCWGNTK